MRQQYVEQKIEFNEIEDNSLEIYSNKYGVIGFIFYENYTHRFVFKPNPKMLFYKPYLLGVILTKLNELNKVK